MYPTLAGFCRSFLIVFVLLNLSQCRLRGKIDSNGVVAAYLEERLNMGVNFLLSAEVSTGCVAVPELVFLIVISTLR